MSDILGTGWAFPPQTDGRGGVAMASGYDKIEQAILIILSTPIGQRVMRPAFGSRLHELVFAPGNPDTLGCAQLYVREALAFWEPRIRVLEVFAQVDPENPNAMLIHIHYMVKATHDRRSLVYPFYRIPGE